MSDWVIKDGQLTLDGGVARQAPTADDIFRSVIEREQRWPDVPPGKSGAASDLRFSRYPALPVMVLVGESGRGAIGFEAQLPDGSRVPLTSGGLRVGHFIANGVWFPLDSEISTALQDMAARAGVPDGGPVQSLRALLNLKKERKSGLLEDRFELDGPATAKMARLPDAVPTGVRATLYQYQKDGWGWLRFVTSERIGGLLADEMGLGKTLQVISLLSDAGPAVVNPALVVAPGSLLENWCRELKRFAPGLSVIKHHGTYRTGSPSGLNDYDVVVTSYETVVRDSALMEMREWAVVILDEAQNIKNPAATRTRAVKRLRRQAGVAVTGTPLENRLVDVWSIMDFVCPGYLGSEDQFRKQYVDSPDDAESLEPVISPLILRRRVSEVAKDLPQRIDVPQVLELDEPSAEQYERLRKSIFDEYGRSASLVALTKLRMYCAHPRLALGTATAADFVKLGRLAELADEIFASGEKLLVFTSFTEMADIIVASLSERFGVFAETLDGRCPIDSRQPLLDRFSDVRGGAVLVLNPRAGGAGLNISAANHVIHYNPEWNPALEDQASARSHRRGQTRPVTVHQLLIAGTVEEAIADRLQRKRALATNAIVGVAGDSEDASDILAAITRSPFIPGLATFMIVSRITKTLSANDTGDTGGHQAGILVPKEPGILSFFPQLDATELNPRCHMMFEDDSGDRWELAFIYYNNRKFGGTRNEYRLTRMTRFIRQKQLEPGDEVVLERLANGGWRIASRKLKVYEQAEQGRFVLKLGSGWRVADV